MKKAVLVVSFLASDEVYRMRVLQPEVITELLEGRYRVAIENSVSCADRFPLEPEKEAK